MATAETEITKTDKSSYYFFKSTPKELQQQYAPVPLKEGQKLDFTPRVNTLHESTLVKKEQERRRAEAAQRKLQEQFDGNAANLTYAQVRKNAYDFRDKQDESFKEPETYQIGQKVTIFGLKKAAKFNEMVAKITAEIKDGRYPVQIVETKKQLNVKRENLKLYRPVVCTEFVTIDLERAFRCTPELLFRALTDADMISKYTQSEAKCNPKPGNTFSLFGGSIHGSFTEATAPSKIVQKWRFKEWPDDHFSTVTIDISSPEYGVTVLKLKQVDVPIHDKFRNRDVPKKVRDGWKNFFFDRIHKVVGFAKVDKNEYDKKAKKDDDGEDLES
mmetsp:Transcript_7524/g.10606  ORF Transcript_7524/g.10606 Transcript_7524/m.10606 type:complete len:330 (+) Transcript_7524:75-1064(+)|eukprot:CAMPEP_0184503794 /NCGR_PEP_ID=MMETSP0113_2-20130426/52098_1 /TAXON_ID=91329 /ORGANISM="Norrisiella sphaerica, Strain BC52" /LENGTH=329 /DNA_ID=CAMNT_0026893351 /DNA_START=167 /DNA_END=1156 /DNA_ORIENTATION=-